MKITFDIDGVLTRYPQELLSLARILKHSGHSVGICTGRDKDHLPENWQDIFDFAITCDGSEEEMRLTGRVATTDQDKMKYWKTAALKEKKVNVHFDDWADVIGEFGGTAIRIGEQK